jgi:hypothetical protein
LWKGINCMGHTHSCCRLILPVDQSKNEKV